MMKNDWGVELTTVGAPQPGVPVGPGYGGFLTGADRVKARLARVNGTAGANGNEPTGHRCPVCGKVCKSPIGLVGHARTHKEPDSSVPSE